MARPFGPQDRHKLSMLESLEQEGTEPTEGVVLRGLRFLLFKTASHRPLLPHTVLEKAQELKLVPFVPFTGASNGESLDSTQDFRLNPHNGGHPPFS